MAEAPNSNGAQFCVMCGTQFAPDDSFCTTCGHPKERASTQTKPTTMHPAAPGTTGQMKAPPPPGYPQASADSQKSNSLRNILVSAATVAVVGGGVYVWSSLQSDTGGVSTAASSPAATSPAVPPTAGARATSPSPQVPDASSPAPYSIPASSAETVVAGLYRAWNSGSESDVLDYLDPAVSASFSASFLSDNNIATVVNYVTTTTPLADGSVEVCGRQTFTKYSGKFQEESRCFNVALSDEQVKVVRTYGLDVIKRF